MTPSERLLLRPTSHQPERLAVAQQAEPRTRRLSRWSGDGWVLLRRKSGATSLATSGGSYGASQMGSVLRYRLSPDHRFDPAIYLRISTALAAPRDTELAVGLAARPVAALPLTAMAELRLNRSRTIHARPAIMVVTGLPPVRLPASLQAEVYGEAGYVGGSYASGFVDGQVRLGHRIGARQSPVRFDAALGLWGGAQRGAARFDLGPSASVAFPLRERGFGRLSADWRFRMAGKAAPGSGPAITLSAGF